MRSRKPISKEASSATGGQSWKHRLYRSAVQYYLSRPAERYSVYRSVFEQLIKRLTIRSARKSDIRFPQRTVGGWWWSWRWRWEILNEWYEYETRAWCRNFIEPGMVVVDIGAHIGAFTWQFSRWVGDSGRVMAFEPNPENFQLLRHNIGVLRCRNVQTECIAVSDVAGESELYLGKGNSTHSLNAGFNRYMGSISVQTTTVDRYLSGAHCQSIDFAKIDVEGAEIRVLKGMRETIARSPGLVMIVELNPKALEAGGHHDRDLVSELRENGFAVYEISDEGQLVTPFSQENARTRNLLCVPQTAIL